MSRSLMVGGRLYSMVHSLMVGGRAGALWALASWAGRLLSCGPLICFVCASWGGSSAPCSGPGLAWPGPAGSAWLACLAGLPKVDWGLGSLQGTHLQRRLALLPAAPPCPAALPLQIKRTSAVTTTVLGEVKIIGLLILSALLLGGWVRG